MRMFNNIIPWGFSRSRHPRRLCLWRSSWGGTASMSWRGVAGWTKHVLQPPVMLRRSCASISSFCTWMVFVLSCREQRGCPFLQSVLTRCACAKLTPAMDFRVRVPMPCGSELIWKHARGRPFFSLLLVYNRSIYRKMKCVFILMEHGKCVLYYSL